MEKLFVRKRELSDMLGISDTTIWRMEKSGDFPRRRRISNNAVGYLLSEIQDWIESRERVYEEERA